MTFASGATAPATIAADSLWHFLLQLGVLLALALLLGNLAVRLDLPPLVGELFAGILLGPSVLGAAAPAVSTWLFAADAVQGPARDAVSQLGVLLLVGFTGLSLQFSGFRQQLKPAITVSVCGVLIPVAVGVGVGYLLPDSVVPVGVDRTVFALFLGAAIGISSVPVIAKTLADMDLLHTKVGTLIIAAGVFDDAVGWLLLSIVSAMAVSGVHPSTALLAFGQLIGFLLVAWLLIRPLVKIAMARAARSGRPGVLLVTVVTVVLLCAAMSQALRLEAVFGAFVAGVVVGSCPGLDRARLEPLHIVVMSILAPIFLTTVGLRVNLTDLTGATALTVAAVLLVIAVLSKFGSGYFGGRVGGLNRWEALSVGAGLNARGVVGIVVASVGLSLGLLTPTMYATVVLIAIVTSLMAPVALRWTTRRDQSQKTGSRLSRNAATPSA